MRIRFRMSKSFRRPASGARWPDQGNDRLSTSSLVKCIDDDVLWMMHLISRHFAQR